jgi:hypothetical protein
MNNAINAANNNTKFPRKRKTEKRKEKSSQVELACCRKEQKKGKTAAHREGVK